MVTANRIDRSLVGVGGIRLINHPGVVYPPEMLHVQKGHDKATGKVFSTPPAWGIPTSEAVRMLRCSGSAARIALHKHKVRFQMVRNPGGSAVIYWHKKQVERVAARQLPLTSEVPEGWVDARTAAGMLRVGRSSLYRYSKRKWLHPRKVRLLTGESGPRVHMYFRRAEVEKLKAHLDAIHARLAEMHRLLGNMDGFADDVPEGGNL